MKIASQEEINKYKQYLLNDETELALEELKKLNRKYPSDGYVLKELGSLMLKLDMNVSEAMLYLSMAINKSNHNFIKNEIGIYYLGKGKYDKAIENFEQIKDDEIKSTCYKLFGLLKVYMRNGEYDKGLSCWYRLREHREAGVFNIEHLNNCRAFLLFKKGVINGNMVQNQNYYERQLFNYNKEEVIDHIYKHLYNDEHEVDSIDYLVNLIFKIPQRDTSIFSTFHDDINIEEIYDYCLNNISNREPDMRTEVDYYKVKLDRSIGETYLGKETNAVEVVVIPNSKDILSIYPANYKKANKYVELKDFERKPYKKVKKNKYNSNKKKK